MATCLVFPKPFFQCPSVQSLRLSFFIMIKFSRNVRMLTMKFYYLIRFQYLGFRYHGWLKQSSRRTVQETIESSVQKILMSSETGFQILGASRTDSMVSAQESFFELITESPVMDLTQFIADLNIDLPP